MDNPPVPNVDSSASPPPSPHSASEDVQSHPSPLTLQAQRPNISSIKLPSAPNMTSSSSPLGNINAARRPGAARGSQLPHDVQARMKAFQLSRQGPPPPQVGNGPFVANERSLSSSQLPSDPSPAQPQPQTLSRGPSLVTTAGTPGAGAGPTASSPVNRPMAPNFNSTPNIPNLNLNPKMGLAAKRGLNMGMKLSDATGPVAPSADRPKAPQPKEVAETPSTGNNASSLFNKYSEYVDTNTGTLNFKGKATIHGQGIDFSGGGSFSMSLDEVDTLDELGKGNYGTVYKVRHSRPKIRKPGQGLRGNRVPTTLAASGLGADETACEATLAPAMNGQTTGIVMAMKEIRLELDEAKFAAIIMELDILHRCVSPFIVDFYGAFFQEGAVYICMEFMDGGSIDKLYGNGVPEAVLRKITLATIMGLKSLKEEHNIIHRDVKPTNILVNTKGQVKICDFGVSGNLVASIAKTNIGCQSYMAPERISGGGIAQAGANPGGGTYSVQSDIWSLGLTIIECGMGRYPYPPETYDNIFSQLSAIVEGDPPDLPADRFSESARDFVRGALNKIPKLRPTYAMLLRHPWLTPLLKPPTIAEDDEEEVEGGKAEEDDIVGIVDPEISRWVGGAIERRRAIGAEGSKPKAPALHAAPLSPS